MLILACSAVCTVRAMADTSVWDEAKRAAYQIKGKITSIATNESEILVRINDGKMTETYKLCSSYPGGDGLNMIESERMKSIREAFKSGDAVTVSYNSPFDRCINSVELTHEDKPEKVVKADHHAL